jgi:hypothetical protein
MRSKVGIAIALAVYLLSGWVSVVPAAEPTEPPPNEGNAPTPPRLSFVDGQVSFWRPGAQDWVQAQLNTAIAPGDQLYTGSPGNLELQIGPRAWLRGWADTQVGLESLEPDFLQVKITSGHAALDLRSLEPGHSVEVDTPNAAFTIDHAGYYRVEVDAERTSFITRRAGQAAVSPVSGETFGIAPSEEVVIEGTQNPKISSYAAPPLDSWDKWNYARTDNLMDAVSARYVPPGVYGASDLDRSGSWRTLPEYGAVWVPTAAPAGWAPYSTGSWILDPYYGWTWVDSAPWGWAPYHYGRWVYLDGYWGWAPGPPVVRPVYAPALVAFFGGAGGGVGIGIAGPAVGWVALGWGEPCVPWWGPPGFARRPWWGGWGGPHVVNNVVVNRTTVVNAENINTYRNAGVRNGMVAVREDRFGHGPITSARIAQVEAQQFHPTHAAPTATAGPGRFTPSLNRGARPPAAVAGRPVVATRAPQALPGDGRERQPGPAPRIVQAPQSRETANPLPRPSFGQSRFERSAADRAAPPAPPKSGASNPAARSPQASSAASRPLRQQQGQAHMTVPPPASPQSPHQRVEAPRATLQRALPGEPANRLSPYRSEARSTEMPGRKPLEKERTRTPSEKPRQGRPIE